MLAYWAACGDSRRRARMLTNVIVQLNIVICSIY